ncbi:MAG: hypothetical protein II379_06705, partial [Oscillospiraceae bacterium]|nr:hypothetical protein [Oscillospiraceae bacterium]
KSSGACQVSLFNLQGTRSNRGTVATILRSPHFVKHYFSFFSTFFSLAMEKRLPAAGNYSLAQLSA